jgi:hypothetical protein
LVLKLKLEIEALQVESFAATSLIEGRMGTVRGHMTDGAHRCNPETQNETDPAYTLNGTCYNTCGAVTQVYTGCGCPPDGGSSGELSCFALTCGMCTGQSQ